MSDEPSRIRRVVSAISPHSTIDRETHAERVLAVVRKKLGIAPRSGPYGPSESSRPVPEKEESP